MGEKKLQINCAPVLKFRPEVSEGREGWGAACELDLDKIRSLVPTLVH
jgi:hypothetical protein